MNISTIRRDLLETERSGVIPIENPIFPRAESTSKTKLKKSLSCPVNIELLSKKQTRKIPMNRMKV
jgi:hypothetical protein